MTVNETPPGKRRTGCLLPLGLYVFAAAAMFTVTQPDPVTGNFDKRTARLFSIVVAGQDDAGIHYRVTSLDAVRSRDPDRPVVDYRLGESDIRIDVGDIHYVRVLEDHGDWQLIQFTYNNSYMGISIYRAYANRVEPVSFHMTSHVGQAMMAMALVIPVYLLAWLITCLRNWRITQSNARRRG